MNKFTMLREPMMPRLFESFSDMLDRMPVEGILVVADAQRKMLEDDLRQQRTPLSTDAISVLSFCKFLQAATNDGHASFPLALPIEHCAFYRTVVQRLVEAGELPYTIQEQIDAVFSRALFRALSCTV